MIRCFLDTNTDLRGYAKRQTKFPVTLLVRPEAKGLEICTVRRMCLFLSDGCYKHPL